MTHVAWAFIQKAKNTPWISPRLKATKQKSSYKQHQLQHHPKKSQEIPRNPKKSSLFPEISTFPGGHGPGSAGGSHLEYYGRAIGGTPGAGRVRNYIIYIWNIWYIHIYMYGYISKVRYLRYLIYMYILGEMGED